MVRCFYIKLDAATLHLIYFFFNILHFYAVGADNSLPHVSSEFLKHIHAPRHPPMTVFPPQAPMMEGI